jgi:hypothetical protein
LGSEQDTSLISEADSGWSYQHLYNLALSARNFKPGLSGSILVGGGDEGVFSERTTHPKSMADQLSLGREGYNEKGETIRMAKGDKWEGDEGDVIMDQQGPGTSSDPHQLNLQGRDKN